MMQFLNVLNGEDIFTQLREKSLSEDRIVAACGRKLLALVVYLHSRGPAPRASATLFQNELWITLRHPSRGVRVWIDWQDFGEVRDGLPVMHYRIQIDKPNSELSENMRLATLVEAACQILTA
jgi:hypothetical protein